MTIEDELGKKLLAIDVFALAIKYLLDDMESDVEKQLIDVSLKDIRLVLTVPAIWSDAGKQFMKEAAVKVVEELIKSVLFLLAHPSTICPSKVVRRQLFLEFLILNSYTNGSEAYSCRLPQRLFKLSTLG